MCVLMTLQSLEEKVKRGITFYTATERAALEPEKGIFSSIVKSRIEGQEG